MQDKLFGGQFEMSKKNDRKCPAVTALWFAPRKMFGMSKVFTKRKY